MLPLSINRGLGVCDVRLAAEVMDELPSTEARTAVQALLADAAGHPGRWPAPGGAEIAHTFGTWCWISYVAYADGLEVRDIGWAL